MADIKTRFKDAIGPASVPSSATHSGKSSEPGVTGLPSQTSSPNCPALVIREGSVSGTPGASGPVKTQFKDAVA